jgi:RNase H-fold protein (predicted Holliday junction resolvase)
VTGPGTLRQDTGRRLLGIDPGRSKCGLAVVAESREIEARSVVRVQDLPREVERLVREYEVGRIVLGSGTGSAKVSSVLTSMLDKLEGVELTEAPEKDTTLRARKLYFEINPARGWRRLLPPGMRIPPESYDDFSAAIIALDFLARRESGQKTEPPKNRKTSPLG